MRQDQARLPVQPAGGYAGHSSASRINDLRIQWITSTPFVGRRAGAFDLRHFRRCAQIVRTPQCYSYYLGRLNHGTLALCVVFRALPMPQHDCRTPSLRVRRFESLKCVKPNDTSAFYQSHFKKNNLFVLGPADAIQSCTDSF